MRKLKPLTKYKLARVIVAYPASMSDQEITNEINWSLGRVECIDDYEIRLSHSIKETGADPAKPFLRGRVDDHIRQASGPDIKGFRAIVKFTSGNTMRHSCRSMEAAEVMIGKFLAKATPDNPAVKATIYQRPKEAKYHQHITWHPVKQIEVPQPNERTE